VAVWLTALKLVPWGDVIEATPQILQAAKKLMGKTRAAEGDDPSADALPRGVEGGTAVPLDTQIHELRTRVSQLEQEQRDSASLIESLAEQNAVVVRAVEALRLRTRRLTWGIGLLGIVCATLLWRIFLQA